MQAAGEAAGHAEQAEDLEGAGRIAQEELDRQEVEEDLGGPEDVVFGLALQAGAVTDLDLGDGDAHRAGDGRDEPVELAVEIDALDDLPAEGLERAAVVVELDAGEPGDEPVRHDGREPARQEPVLPVLPPAGDDVVAGVDLGEQGGDVGRIVLEVGVQGDDDVPPGEVEPRGQGGRLAEVPPEPDDADPRIPGPEALQGLERAVRAAVVDEDDLVGLPQAGADPAELRDRARGGSPPR